MPVQGVLMYDIAPIDLDKVERLTVKLPSNIPKQLAKIPTVEQEKKLLSYIKGNAIWLILTYGAGILSFVSPVAAKALRGFIKWRFNWTQKDLPFEI